MLPSDEPPWVAERRDRPIHQRAYATPLRTIDETFARLTRRRGHSSDGFEQQLGSITSAVSIDPAHLFSLLRAGDTELVEPDWYSAFGGRTPPKTQRVAQRSGHWHDITHPGPGQVLLRHRIHVEATNDGSTLRHELSSVDAVTIAEGTLEAAARDVVDRLEHQAASSNPLEVDAGVRLSARGVLGGNTIKGRVGTHRFRLEHRTTNPVAGFLPGRNDVERIVGTIGRTKLDLKPRGRSEGTAKVGRFTVVRAAGEVNLDGASALLHCSPGSGSFRWKSPDLTVAFSNCGRDADDLVGSVVAIGSAAGDEDLVHAIALVGAAWASGYENHQG